MNKQLLRVIQEQNNFKKLECGVVAPFCRTKEQVVNYCTDYFKQLLASQNLKSPTKKAVQNINVTSGESTL